MKPWLNVLWVALAAAGGYLTALNKTGVEEAPRTITEVVKMDLGEILEKENDIIGDDVNITARIEPFSATGGIAISNKINEPLFWG